MDKMIVFTFDDGFKTDYTEAFKYMKQFNAKGTSYLITEWLKPGAKNAQLDWLDIIEMKAHGWDFQCHINHNNTKSDLINLFEKTNEYFETKGFKSPRHHAPHVNKTEAGRRISQSYRLTSTQPSRPALMVECESSLFSLERIGSMAKDQARYEEICDTIDSSIGTMQTPVLMFHEIYEEDDSLTYFKKLVDYAVEKNMQIVTIAELYDVLLRCKGMLRFPPGVLLHLSADRIDQSHNSKIEFWADYSGKENHAVQPSEDSKPTLIKKSINGLPAVKFDGNNDFLSIDNFEAPQPNHVFAVFKCNSSSGDTRLFDVDGAGRQTMRIRNGRLSGDIFAGSTLTNESSYADGYTLETYSFNGSNSEIRRNRNLVAEGNAGGNEVSGTFRIGTRNTATGQFGDIEIAELIVFEGVLTDQDRDIIEKYLMRKYDL